MVNKIIKSISVTLNRVFGDDFEVYFSKDVQQGLREPCFFISLTRSSEKRRIGRRYRLENSFSVTYFPKTEQGNTEMMGVAERLYEALEVIELIDGDSVHAAAMNYSIQDGVLHFFVDFNVFLKRESDFEEMETVTVDSNITQEG